MDFTLSEEQQAISDLAAQIFEGQATIERVKQVERSEDRFDRRLWSELAKANLLGLCLPEDVGGSGLGVIEMAVLLEQQGRRVAPVPLLPTLAMGALALAEFGSEAQRRAWLPRVVAGDVVLSAALAEPGDGAATDPSATAVRDGAGWRVSGTRLAVPWAHVAERVLVPARSGDGVVVVLVDPAGPGVERQLTETTNHEIHPHLILDAAPGEQLGAPGAGIGILERILEWTIVGIAALQVGVAEEAVALAAAYTSEREQFGRPLSTFQGVALRAADAYIDTEAMRVTMWQAAWLLAQGRNASAEVEVAKFWASEGGHRVVHATQHLHGGMGSDIDYPVHRYFLWGKQLEDLLGGTSYHLARLGRLLAGAGFVGGTRGR